MTKMIFPVLIVFSLSAGNALADPPLQGLWDKGAGAVSSLAASVAGAVQAKIDGLLDRRDKAIATVLSPSPPAPKPGDPDYTDNIFSQPGSTSAPDAYYKKYSPRDRHEWDLVNQAEDAHNAANDATKPAVRESYQRLELSLIQQLMEYRALRIAPPKQPDGNGTGLPDGTSNTPTEPDPAVAAADLGSGVHAGTTEVGDVQPDATPSASELTALINQQAAKSGDIVNALGVTATGSQTSTDNANLALVPDPVSIDPVTTAADDGQTSTQVSAQPARTSITPIGSEPEVPVDQAGPAVAARDTAGETGPQTTASQVSTQPDGTSGSSQMSTTSTKVASGDEKPAASNEPAGQPSDGTADLTTQLQQQGAEAAGSQGDDQSNLTALTQDETKADEAARSPGPPPADEVTLDAELDTAMAAATANEGADADTSFESQSRDDTNSWSSSIHGLVATYLNSQRQIDEIAQQQQDEQNTQVFENALGAFVQGFESGSARPYSSGGSSSGSAGSPTVRYARPAPRPCIDGGGHPVILQGNVVDMC